MKDQKILAVIVFVFCLSMSSFSNSADQVAPQKDSVLVGTGDPKGTYSIMFNDLKPFCNGMAEEFTESKSGFQSIGFLLGRKIDAAIVQADVMGYMDRTDEMVSKKLRALAALHANSMHIIVLREGTMVKTEGWMGKKSTVVVENLRQLANRPVAVFGSAEITAIIINERLKLNLIPIDASTYQEGLAKLQRGEVFALLAMGGKPINWVEQLDGKIYSLANTESGDIAAMQKPYKNIQVSYPNLRVVGANTLSVNNDIIVWDYQSGKQAAKLLAFKKYLENSLEEIKDTRGSHPSWQSVEAENLSNVSWPAYSPKLTAAETSAPSVVEKTVSKKKQ